MILQRLIPLTNDINLIPSHQFATATRRKCHIPWYTGGPLANPENTYVQGDNKALLDKVNYC